MKKNTPETESPPLPSPVKEKMTDLIQSHGSQVLVFLLVLFTVFLIFYKLSTGTAHQSVQDYMNAQALFDRLSQEKLPIIDGEDTSYSKLMTLINSHPELHAKYDAPLAQILLSTGHINASIPLTTLLLNRTKDELLRFYHDFTKTSLLISQGRTNEALQDAETLQEKLSENEQLALSHPEKRAYGKLLYPYHLLRMATIYQKLGQKEQELSAWEAFDQYLQNHKDIYSKMSNHLSSGSFSLEEYVQIRREILQKDSPQNNLPNAG